MDGLAEKDVVVEVDEVVGEVGNVVEVQLDGGGGECREAVGHAEDVFVEHDADFGVGKVQPAGDLAVGHDVDVVDPRSVRLQGSDAVSRGKKTRTETTSARRCRGNGSWRWKCLSHSRLCCGISCR